MYRMTITTDLHRFPNGVFEKQADAEKEAERICKEGIWHRCDDPGTESALWEATYHPCHSILRIRIYET